MSEPPNRPAPPPRGTWALRIALGAAALFAAGPALSWARILSGGFGLALAGVGALAGLGAALTGGWAAIRGARRRGLLALAIGVVPSAVIAIAAGPGLSAPPINDISTDLEHPPRLAPAAADGAGEPEGYSSEHAETIRRAYPDLAPLQSKEAAEPLLTAAAAALERVAGCRVTTRTAGSVFGECQSALFHFVDDVAIRARAEGHGTRLDIRSKSRVGKSDLGANARRIREILRHLGR